MIRKWHAVAVAVVVSTGAMLLAGVVIPGIGPKVDIPGKRHLVASDRVDVSEMATVISSRDVREGDGFGSQVQGFVQIRGTAKDLPGVPVRVLQSRDGNWCEHATLTTDAEGGFAVSGLDAGLYRLMPGLEGIPEDEVSTVEIRIPRSDGEPVFLEWEQCEGKGSVTVTGSVRFDSGRVPSVFSFDLGVPGRPQDGKWHVQGSNGVFKKRLPFSGSFLVSSMTVDGEVMPGLATIVQVSNSQCEPITVCEENEAGVLVIDGRSGEPIIDALVFVGQDEESEVGMIAPSAILPPNHHNPPGPETLGRQPFMTDATGRASIGRGRNIGEVWIIAAGFAWSRVKVDYAKGGEERVELIPGGGLQVSILDWMRCHGGYVLAWEVKPGQSEAAPSGMPIQFFRPDKDGVVSVDGVPVGHYLVRVQRGNWLEDGEVYGSGVVQVVQGEKATLTIAADGVVPVATRKILLLLAPGWPEKPTGVQVRGLDAGREGIIEFYPVLELLDARSFRLQTEPLPAGQYRVKVQPMGWMTDVAIAPGTETLSVKVPAPATVCLSVNDSVDGEPLRSAVVRWTASHQEMSSDSEAFENDGPGKFRIVVPPGTTWVRVMCNGYQSQRLEVRTSSGEEVKQTVALVGRAENR